MLKKKFMYTVFMLTAAILFVASPDGARTSLAAEVTELPIDQAHFPSEAFRRYLGFQDSDKNGALNEEEIASVTRIYVDYSNISDLTGIEYFPNLRTLDCSNNNLTTLDVSQNPALKYLNCSNNNLTNLDVGNNTLLSTLNCSSNKLKSLDVSKNESLSVLSCNTNQLSTLSLSKNSSLTGLACAENNLTSLDVSSNPKLKTLYCIKNKLTNLNITNCAAMAGLSCYENNLTALNLCDNLALEDLSCGNNDLSSLDTSSNPSLTYLSCDNNKLVSLNVAQNSSLERLYCYNNNLTSLDTTGNISLEILHCNDNQLSDLDLSENTSLNWLDCHSNYLKALDITHNLSLTNLDCSFNNLTDLDISNNANIHSLYCGNNYLNDLNISANLNLSDLRCDYNNLTSLDLASNLELYTLNCNNNYLTHLNLSQNSNLSNNTFGNISDQISLATVIQKEGKWQINLNTLTGDGDSARINITDPNWTAGSDGWYIYKLDEKPLSISYDYDTGLPDTLYYYHRMHVKAMFMDKIDTVAINKSNFPDERLRSYISEQFDQNKNETLEFREIIFVTNIYLDNQGISDLKGIEYFKSLETLSCGDNNLTSLDMSGNPMLTSLHCVNNHLTDLNLTKNTLLEFLCLENNRLTTLDLSQNNLLSSDIMLEQEIRTDVIKRDGKWQISMSELIGEEQMSNVKFEDNMWEESSDGWYVYHLDTRPLFLKYQYNTGSDEKNLFVTLTFTDGVMLDKTNFPDASFRTYVQENCDLDGDKILSIHEIESVKHIGVGSREIENLKGIEYFVCLEYLSCQYNNLTSLDISSNYNLTELDCVSSNLVSLDLTNSPNLTHLFCSMNNLTSLDLSNNPLLKELYCNDNALTSLNISSNSALEHLECSTNCLTNLDLTNNIALTVLSCNYNHLTNLDLKNNLALTELICVSNDLTTLDNINNHPSLTVIECADNCLTSLNPSNNPMLMSLFCSGNKLVNLDLSNTPVLNYLDCSINELSSLDLNSSPELEYLICSENNLYDLDICNITNLVHLACGNNNITSLNLNYCPNLTFLACFNNNLSNLNLNACPMLTSLGCDNNHLTALKLNKNLALEELYPGTQTITSEVHPKDNGWILDLTTIVSAEELGRVTVPTIGAKKSGKYVTFSGTQAPENFRYLYNTESNAENNLMNVFVELSVDDTPLPPTDIDTPNPPEKDDDPNPPVKDDDPTPPSEDDDPKQPSENHTHSFGTYITTKEATALAEGIQTRTCSVCGQTETRTVPKLIPTITLNATAIPLRIKQSTSKLMVSGLAAGDYVKSWESSNTKIVRVDNKGKITAQKKTGKATITVTLASGKQARISVKVQKPLVKTTKISGISKKLSLTKGQTIGLKPVITPITSLEKVKYKSSSAKVVSVSKKGVIKAKAPGKAKITVSSGKKKINITVTVQ